MYFLPTAASISKPLGTYILPSCQKSPTCPPWSHCYPQWRPPASWPPPPYCFHGEMRTWSWSIFASSAPWSWLPSFSPSASWVRHQKTRTQPTWVARSVRTPHIGAVPLITSQWWTRSDTNIGTGRLIFDCLSEYLGLHCCCFSGINVSHHC